MDTMRKIRFIVLFVLVSLETLAQTPVYSCRRAFDTEGSSISREQYDDDYRKLYINFQKSIYVRKPVGIEIKSKNPKYRKIRLYPDYILSHELKGETNSPSETKSYNNDKYSYLYMALVELAPDSQGKIKEQVLLFFSSHNIRAKQKYKSDTKTANVKEIASDIDKNPIVLSETQPDVFLEAYQYYTGDNSPKLKVFGTNTYIYNINSLHPNRTPFIIGKLFQFKPDLQSDKNYESMMLFNYNKNGKLSSTTEYIPKDGGEYLQLEYVKKFDENGQLKEAGFEINSSVKTGEKTEYVGTWKNGYSVMQNVYTNKKVLSFGVDIPNNNPFFKTKMMLPAGIQKNWQSNVRNFNTEPNLLEDLREHLSKEPIEDMEQFKEFLSNFQTLNELVILDETTINAHRVPIRYIYKGTYDKNGLPHGWGLIYTSNANEYYLGQFKKGMPDGFGLRQDFRLDKPEKHFSSQGMHVGNTLVYGLKYTPTVNSNGFNIDYGDFRQGGELNGTGCHIWSQGDNGIGDLYYGSFKNGRLHGMGSYFSNSKKEIGEFENGKLVSGNSATDKIYDDRFYPGAVVVYQGKKYVIMKKEKGMFLLDNGTSVSTKADLALTGERSLRSEPCLVCNGTGYMNPVTNTVFSGVTKKEKTYQTGPTGYILWEKTTTSTTAPVITHRTNRCTACTGGLSGSNPVPLNASQ